MYPTLTNLAQRKRKTYDANDLLALSLVSIINYIYSLGKSFIVQIQQQQHEMIIVLCKTFKRENARTTCKNMKKKKTRERFFNTFNR